MLDTFTNVPITPSLARKLLLLTTVFPIEMPESVQNLAEQNLYDDDYTQFLCDNNLRTIIFYNNFTHFLDKTIDYLINHTNQSNIFVFDNILFFSSNISSVMKDKGATYKIVNNKSKIDFDETVKFYFVDFNTLSHISESIFFERQASSVFMEMNSFYINQAVTSIQLNLFPNINLFGEQKYEDNTEVYKHAVNKLFGNNNLQQLLISNKYKKWMAESDFNFNKDVIEYVSGISKHLN